jgi:hypothetical protein
VVRIELLGPFGRELSRLAFASDTAAAQGDGNVALLIGAVVLVIIVILVDLGRIKSKRYSPDDPTPWTGSYEATLKARAFSEKGKPLPPPSPSLKGPNWKLKEAHSTSQWLVVAMLLGILGVLAYSQLDLSTLPQLASNSTGPVNTTPPVNHPGSAEQVQHHAINRSRQVRHGQQGVRKPVRVSPHGTRRIGD